MPGARLGSELLACPTTFFMVPGSFVFARAGHKLQTRGTLVHIVNITMMFCYCYVRFCFIVVFSLVDTYWEVSSLFGLPSSWMWCFWLLVFFKADYLSLSCYRLSRYSFVRQSYHSLDKVVQIQFSEVLFQPLCGLCLIFSCGILWWSVTFVLRLTTFSWVVKGCLDTFILDNITLVLGNVIQIQFMEVV